jgi:hypothetical protein
MGRFRCKSRRSRLLRFLCDPAAPRAIAGCGRLTILASRLRFCAIVASVNSNCAPLGPHRRNRSSPRTRLRCANSISICLRSQRECANASVGEIAGYIACSLVHATDDPSCRHVREALRLSGHPPHSGIEVISETSRSIAGHFVRSRDNGSPCGVHCSQ